MPSGQRLKQIKKTSETLVSRDVFTELYMKDIRHYPLLTADEEKDLIDKAQKGDQIAKNKIITSNLRFVVNCAKEYQNTNITILDLINAGNIGLCLAVDKFDNERVPRMKFISYAVWWIKKEIVEFLRDNNRTVRLPYNQQDDIYHYVKIKQLVEQKLEIEEASFEQIMEGYESLNEEIAMKNSIPTINPEMKTFESNKVKKNLIRKPSQEILPFSLAAYKNSTSLSQQIDSQSEDSLTFEDILGNNPEVEIEINNQDNSLIVKELLSKLSPLERSVIELTYGLSDYKIPYSNDDIAAKLNVTPERIRQMKKKILTNLKNTIKKDKGLLQSVEN